MYIKLTYNCFLITHYTLSKLFYPWLHPLDTKYLSHRLHLRPYSPFWSAENDFETNRTNETGMYTFDSCIHCKFNNE